MVFRQPMQRCGATVGLSSNCAWQHILRLTVISYAQYVLMFIANGEPGNVRKAMASVAAARKVFRVFRVMLWHTLGEEA